MRTQNQKVILYLKPGFKRFFLKIFMIDTKMNQTQICFSEFH